MAQRALAFGMRIVAYDPYVSAERARQMSVELLPVDRLVEEADFLTVHLPKTPETVGLIGAELLAKAKPELRVINVARGGIVDEAALADAMREGRIAGAALDVFASEPTTESPLFDLAQRGRHPPPRRQHPRGAGQGGRHDRRDGAAGPGRRVRAVRRERERRRGGRDRAAVPAAGRAPRAACSPSLAEGVPDTVEVAYEGQLADYDTRILTLSVLKGLFGGVSDEPVTFVNAPQPGQGARRRGAGGHVGHVGRLRQPGHRPRRRPRPRRHAVGRRGEPRIVNVDDHTIDLPPAANMLVVRNDDRPGMIGYVGTVLGDAGVNIADMDVGRSQARSAIMVLATTEADAGRRDPSELPGGARHPVGARAAGGVRAATPRR